MVTPAGFTQLYPPNAFRDFSAGKQEFFIGAFDRKVFSLDQEGLRLVQERIVEANFASKETVTQATQDYSKVTSWQVIRTVISQKPLVLLATAGTLLSYVCSYYLYRQQQTTPFKALAARCVALFLAPFSTGIFLGLSIPEIRKTQKAFQDIYIVNLKLAQIPSSMAGFDLDQLSNGKEDDKYVNPITLEPIAEITAPTILRVGTYAMDIREALEVMLGRNIRGSSLGEIPHPIEQRILTEEEQDKFLTDVAAFFGVLKPDMITAPWQVDLPQLGPEQWVSMDSNWNSLTEAQQAAQDTHLTKHVILLARKTSFLNLLPKSIQDRYFADLVKKDYASFQPLIWAAPANGDVEG